MRFPFVWFWNWNRKRIVRPFARTLQVLSQMGNFKAVVSACDPWFSYLHFRAHLQILSVFLTFYEQ